MFSCFLILQRWILSVRWKLCSGYRYGRDRAMAIARRMEYIWNKDAAKAPFGV